MSSTPIDPALRDRLLADPSAILEDPDLMRALAEANGRALGSNVVDLRGIAMERLEARFDRLEDTHRTVIATAYENLAGTQQIHRAVLRMLDALEFETFLSDLGGEVADILQVDRLRLVLEAAEGAEAPRLEGAAELLVAAPQGFIESYVNQGRQVPYRQVRLRLMQDPAPELYGEGAGALRSEACLRLDFGAGRLPGMLLLASEESEQFAPQHGTELLAFFAGVLERVMRRWLG